MGYIKIEGIEVHTDAVLNFSFEEFKDKHPKIKDAKKAWIELGGSFPKAKAKKEADKD